MAGRVGRPIFRRNVDYVAVRPIKLNGTTTLEPGTPVTREQFRLHHLKSLYLRRRIGPKDHPWTIEMLANQGFHRPEFHKPGPKTEPDPSPVELPEPVKDGNKWRHPDVSEPSFRTKKEAAAWIEENHADVSTILEEIEEEEFQEQEVEGLLEDDDSWLEGEADETEADETEQEDENGAQS